MNKKEQNYNKPKALIIINRLIVASYAALIFFTPLVFALFIRNNNVFELNKVIFVRCLVIILGLLTAVKVLFFSENLSVRPAFKFFKKYLLAPILLFLFLGLSVLWSSDPWLSFYGLNDRQQGFRSLVFYGLAFALIFYDFISAANREGFLKKLKIVALAASASAFVAGIYALVQLVGWDFISWMEPAYLTHRTTSTLGQPNFLASFMLLAMPWGFYLFIGAKKNWLKIASIGIVGLEFITILSTASRSALGGLVLSALIILAIWFVSSRSYRNRKVLLIISASIIAAFIFAFALWASSSFVKQRVSDTINNSGGWSMSVRRFFWKASWEEIKKRPLIGYGLETQEMLIGSHYEADWARFGEVNALTNRAHNWFLDNLLTGGIIGLLLWIYLWWKLFYLSKSSFNKNWDYLGLWLAAGAGAHFISLQPGFDVTVTSLYWWLILAVIFAADYFANNSVGLSEANIVESEKNNKSKKIIRPALAVLVFLVLLLVSITTISKDVRFLRADYSYRKMREALSVKDYVKALIEYSKIVPAKERSGEIEYYLSDALPWNLLDIIPEEIKPSITDMLGQVSSSRTIDNQDSFFVKAKISAILKDYDNSRYYFDRLAAVQTNWPKVYFNRGQLRLLSGDQDGAMDDWRRAMVLLPDEDSDISNPKYIRSIRYYLALVYQNLADLLMERQDYVQAEKYYQQAYKRNLSNLVLLKKIADTYYGRHDFDKAIYYNELGFIRQPDDYHWPLAIAMLYQEKGDKQKAKDYAKLTLEIDPENFDAKGILSEK